MFSYVPIGTVLNYTSMTGDPMYMSVTGPSCYFTPPNEMDSTREILEQMRQTKEQLVLVNEQAKTQQRELHEKLTSLRKTLERICLHEDGWVYETIENDDGSYSDGDACKTCGYLEYK